MADPVKVARLEKLFDQLDPFDLSKIVDCKLKIICGMASRLTHVPARSMSKRQHEFLKRNLFEEDWAGGPMKFPGSILNQYRKAWYKDSLLGAR